MKNQLPYTKDEDKINELENKVKYYEDYINNIQSSIGWKIISNIRNNPILYSFTKPARKLVQNLFERNANKNKVDYISSIEENILNIPPNVVLAICHANWIGVKHSTEALFQYNLYINEIYSKKEATTIANLISKKNITCIVFSGFAEGYQLLARQLKLINPQVKIMVFWHGNTTHMYEDYSWDRHCEIMKLCSEGIIDKVGFAKLSMVELYSKIGISTEFVMNYVPKNNVESKTDLRFINDNSIKIGLYASGNTWNKNAYTQIAAGKFISNSIINAIPCSERMKEFANQIGVRINGDKNVIPRNELLKHMGSNDINFYVTFSECAPILPLESLNLGVPCITGPNHHYFDNHPLYDYLVVRKPDDSKEIADKAAFAIENKSEIIKLYNEWYNENLCKSMKSVERFIGEIYE